MKHFLKYTAVTLSLMASLTTYAATTDNNNAPSTPKNLLEKQQAANAQNATNSLILWLNNNLVNGTPLDFAKSMKGNWGNILVNEGVNNLNWQLTKAITFVALKGDTPSDEKVNNEASNTALAQQNKITPNTIGAAIAQLNTVNQARLVPKSIDKDSVINQKLAQFNIGKLLSTNTIAPNSEDEKNAQILMQFISGLATSIGPLSAQDLQKNGGPIDNFQQLYGVYVAQQSIGLNSLYNLLTERRVQKGLGTQLGGPQADMSPLALDQYMATRRLNVNDPNGWLAQVSTAKPAVVSKEELMLLAEIRYELFETRRVLASMQQLMAVQELQNNALKEPVLDRLQSDVSSSTLPNMIN